MVVAAVGNDGPAAPPQYPACYDGVIAVTGVDANGKALLEAGRARHLDFAAPGADLAAALPGKGYARFAAPASPRRSPPRGWPRPDRPTPRRRSAPGQGQGRPRDRLRRLQGRAAQRRRAKYFAPAG